MAWFITFEGTDRAGKSTQIALFQTYLDRRGIAHLFTREPGGCPVSERIREVILDPENQMHPLCEALLYAAARSELVHKVLLPQLQMGVNIVCDRYVDSSIAYQGFGREMGMDVIAGINAYATEKLMPDLTFFLSMDPECAMQRASGEQDRIEQAGRNFRQRVYQGYCTLAQREPTRFCVIDAAQSIENVHAQIVRAFEARFPHA